MIQNGTWRKICLSPLIHRLALYEHLIPKMDVNANNIANVNTSNFKRSRVNMQEAAAGGVQVSVQKIDEPGLSLGTDEVTGKEVETSNVDLGSEFVDQIVTQYSFEANIVSIKTAEDMQKTLLDIMS